MDPSTLSTAVDITGTLLMHSVWQGIAVGLLYALTMLCLGGASPRSRYGAALFWLIALALAPLATSIWLLGDGGLPWHLLPAVFAVVVPGPIFDFQAMAPLITSLWLAGVALLGIRLVWNWRCAQRLTFLGCQPLPSYWNERFALLSVRMGIRRSVRIVESVLISVPTVIGWLKPVILIPSSALLGLSKRQLELIIAHELAHIRRYDYVVNYFLLVMETLFFYHPVVYVIGRGLRDERELCCDDLVVSRCGGRVEYVTALTDLETLRSGHVLSEPLSNLAATGGNLLHRVHRIVRGHAPVLRGVHIITVASALTIMLGYAVFFAKERAPRAAPASLASALLSQPLDAIVEMDASARFMGTPASFLPTHLDIATLPRTRAPRRHARTDGTTVPVTPDTESVALPQPIVALAVESLPRPTKIEHAAVDPDVISVAERTAAVQLATIPADKTSEPAGPTFAMMTELHLSSVSRDSLTDLKRDASDALRLDESPYVIVGPENIESDYIVSDEVREEGGALIKRIEPRYPSLARLRGYTDTVQIEFRVTGSGHVEDIVIVSGSRSSFERAVVRAVKKWRYEPLLRDGIPVERTVVETFAFMRGVPGSPARGGCHHDKSKNAFSCSSPGLSRVL